MKKSILMLALLVGLVLATNSCVVSAGSEKGSGNVIRQERSAGDFSSVKLNGSANVIIEQGDKNSIYVETDDNIMEFIETKISGGVLDIDCNQSISPTKLVVYVMMKNVKELSIFGSGDIFGKYLIKSNDLTLNLSGSGDINLKQLEAEALKASVNGSGDIEASGSAKSTTLELKGSGDISFKNLQTNSCEAEVIGSGDITINVSEKLKANVIGSGDITYWGNPAETKFGTTGSGDIKKGK